MRDAIGRRGLAGLAGSALLPAAARAQGQAQTAPAPSGPPLRIGMSMSLTGGLAVNGRPAHVTHQIWARDVNARGGLLGRPVQIVHYDDQSSGAQVPGIYQKLIDVDRVDLVVSGYATSIIAPAMPVVMQRGMAFVSLYGTGVNSEFKYDRYIAINPAGSDVRGTFARGWFDIAQTLEPRPRSVAILALDADFLQRVADSVRHLARERGVRVVYDRSYPPTTVDFSSTLRALLAARPELIYVASYPPDTAAILRTANEIRLSARMFGGCMIGSNSAPQKTQFGPILNNLISWDTSMVPEPTLNFPGIQDVLIRYREVAARENVDPLGMFAPPFAYAQMQVLEQAVARVGRIDQAAIAADMHANAFPTVIGELRFDAQGEWVEERNIYVQYQGIQGNALEQFLRPGVQVILAPERYRSGTLRSPFPAA